MSEELTFGKYKGQPIGLLPDDYLQWGVDNLEDDDWRDRFEEELIRRRDNKWT